MGRKKTYDRADVLHRAMELFWRKGFSGTHLQELVEVTGLNRFGLYKEFGGKDGLFDEAMSLYLSKLAETLKPLGREPRGMGNINAYFRELEMEFFLHGCFLTNSLTEKNVINSGTYQKMVIAYDGFQQLARANLEAAQADGDIGPQVNLDAIQHFLAALDLGIVVHSINAEASDKDRIVALLEIFLNGLKESK